MGNTMRAIAMPGKGQDAFFQIFYLEMRIDTRIFVYDYTCIYV